MTLAEHVGETDVLIYPSRADRQERKMVIWPAVDVVVLQVGDGLAIEFNYPSADSAVGQLFPFVFGFGFVPPFRNVRS